MSQWKHSELVKAIKSKTIMEKGTPRSVVDLDTLPAAAKYHPTAADHAYRDDWNAKLAQDQAVGMRINEVPLDPPADFVNGGAITGLLLGTIQELITRVEALEAK